MAITRIKNNQITDSSAGNVFLGINAAVKLQDFSITAGKIANSLVYGSDLTVSGNLTVNGTTTTIDTVSVVIEDPILLLAANQTGAPSLDIGFIGERGTDTNIAFVWDESADEFVTAFTTDTTTNTTITVSSYASFHTKDANIGGNIVINGTTSLVGNITSAVAITGNLSAGNISTAGQISAVGNISGGNLNAVANVETANLRVTSMTANRVTFTDPNDYLITTQNFTYDGVTANIQGQLIVDNVTINGTEIASDANLTISSTGNGNIDISPAGNGVVNINSITIADNTIGSSTGNIVLDPSANIVLPDETASAVLYLTASKQIESSANFVYDGTTANIQGALVIDNVRVDGNEISTTNANGNLTLTPNGTGSLVVDAENSNFSGNVTTTGNVNAGTAVNANVISGTSVQINSTGDIVLNPTGNINASGVRIRNMSDPQLAFDAATKQYVDDAVSSGIHIHTPVDVETEAPLTTVTYANGGNTFTVNQTIAGNIVVFTTAANLQVNDSLWFTNSFNGVVGNVAYFVVSTPNTSAAVLSTAYNGVPVANITSGSGLTEPVRVNSGIGATLTATANGGLVVDGVSLVAGNRVLVRDQLNQIQNGVYSVTDAGNVSAPYILTRSSDTNTYEPDTSTGLDQGSYFYVQYGNVGAGSSYVKTEPAGPFIFGVANLVFTQFSSSQVYSANTNAGLSLTGTVFAAKVDNNTTAFDGGGNIIVKTGANLTTPNIGNATGNSLTLSGNGLLSATTVTATGNVSGGNLTTGGDVTTVTVTASGNIIGANVNATLGVTAGTTVTATGNVSGGNLTTVGRVTATGNITGGNLTTAGLTSTATLNASGNANVGNLGTAGLIVATGNIDGGNLNTGAQVVATGNVTGGNINTGGQVVATGNITGANVIGTTSGKFGNIVISGDDITDVGGGRVTINVAGADVDFSVNGDTTANIFYVDAGTGTASFGNSTQVTNAIVSFQSTNSILIPRGNSAQRPATSVTGMIRFNTTTDNLEFYDADGWVSAGSVFTVIDSQIFNGDGSTVVFTLGSDQTSDSCIVSINGIVQIPVTSYAVSGNVMTFTEAPQSQDVIEVRQITTTAAVKSISNTPGNAIIEVSDTSNDISITGDLIPTANIAFDLGSSALRWRDGYFSGNSITLGNIVLKNTSGNTLAFFGPDGTTPGVLSSNNVDTTSIANGTSNVQTLTSGAVTLSAGGNANVVVVANGSVTVKANILNGQGNGVGNIGNSTTYFNTIFAKATSAQYADLAEMYAADANIEPGTVVCFGGTAEVTGCTEEACKRVAGVISTNPSYIMNSAQEGDHVVAVALTGRVPTRVTGPVRKGDMMVSTADGRARTEPDPRVGTVIGKALEDFDGIEGVIEVVVGRI